MIVGPDGSGKTTIARVLLERWEGPTGYFHFCPPPRGGLPSVPGDGGMAPDKNPVGTSFTGWIRMTRNFLRMWWGYCMSVRPLRRAGGLVVGDRFGYGYHGQPRALKFFGPDWLGSAMVRILPRPDVVVNLVAPPAVIHSRKKDLDVGAIDQELSRWRSLPISALLTVDVTDRTPVQVVEFIETSMPSIWPRGDSVAD